MIRVEISERELTNHITETLNIAMQESLKDWITQSLRRVISEQIEAHGSAIVTKLLKERISDYCKAVLESVNAEEMVARETENFIKENFGVIVKMAVNKINAQIQNDRCKE